MAHTVMVTCVSMHEHSVETTCPPIESGLDHCDCWAFRDVVVDDFVVDLVVDLVVVLGAEFRLLTTGTPTVTVTAGSGK